MLSLLNVSAALPLICIQICFGGSKNCPFSIIGLGLLLSNLHVRRLHQVTQPYFKLIGVKALSWPAVGRLGRATDGKQVFRL